MVMVSRFVGFAQVRRVEPLVDITANLPRVNPTRHAAVCVIAAFGGCQFLRPFITGFPADSNLFCWQVSTL
ncbi:Uncharacterised protein [Klebsiella pneumoniae]|nr:Uncharacterised protein [Klebsiella pneumoniae]